ncbi:MAG: hypothetical protein HY582_05060 [Candidatus Omnitrophica bacterium]|nr:hypothetical protein [Candidatus Omnitrophota bacterium]
MSQFLRNWKEFDIQDITRHLLILGDLSGDCANCRELGIDTWKALECPKCHTKFKFIASRRSADHPGERFQLARRMSEGRRDLMVVDYDDYHRTIGGQKARDFFKS